MRRLKLLLFTLDQYSAYAMNRAGAEMCGGEARRRRTMAHRDLTLEGLEALKAEMAHTQPNASRTPAE